MATQIYILLAIIMPMAIMSSQTIPSPIFYIMAILAIIIIARSDFNKAKNILKDNKLLFLIMGAPLLALLISSLIHGKLVGLDLEVALRIFLGTTIFGLAFSLTEKKILDKTVCGFIGAGLLASCYIFYLITTGHETRPQTSAVYNAVGYGSLTALFMIISLFATRLDTTKNPKLEVGIKLIIAIIAFIAVIITQTRTAWMAMPVFIVIAAILFAPVKKTPADQKRPINKNLIFKVIGLAVIALIAISAVFASSQTMRNRATLAYNEAVNCVGDQSTTDSSICIRFQLWRASLDMVSERPWSGNGSKRYFNDYLQQESFAKGIVSPFVAENWGEPHNDLLLAASSFGILGGIALLLIYLVPAGIFLKRLSYRNSPEIRAAAAMGVCLCLGFMIFGFTETMFRSMRTVGFYTMGIALFAALSSPRLHQN